LTTQGRKHLVHLCHADGTRVALDVRYAILADAYEESEVGLSQPTRFA
jgi:hypothetical protein